MFWDTFVIRPCLLVKTTHLFRSITLKLKLAWNYRQKYMIFKNQNTVVQILGVKKKEGHHCFLWVTKFL